MIDSKTQKTTPRKLTLVAARYCDHVKRHGHIVNLISEADSNRGGVLGKTEIGVLLAVSPPSIHTQPILVLPSRGRTQVRASILKFILPLAASPILRSHTARNHTSTRTRGCQDKL